MSLGVGSGRQFAPRRTIDQAGIATDAERWLRYLRDDRRLATTTVNTYRSQLALVLRQPDPDRTLSARLSPQAGAHTRRKTYVVWDQFYRWRAAERGVPNPLAAMRPPPKPDSRRRSLTPVELEMLQARIEGATAKDRCAVLLQLLQGARPSDVVNLMLEDIDFEGLRIRFRHRKGARDKGWLPIGPTLARELRAYLDEYDIQGGYAFPGPKGRMTVQAIWKGWRRVAGPKLRYLCEYQLRHSFANRLLRGSRADVNTVRKLMGHRSLATTQLYLDDDPDEERAAILSLPGLVGMRADR